MLKDMRWLILLEVAEKAALPNPGTEKLRLFWIITPPKGDIEKQ
jgi:hypothetical protein